MSLDQKAMGVLKLYLWDYPIEDNKWHLFDKWGIQQQPWAEREGKRGYLYRYREDGSELVRAIIVNYFDPPKPLAPGQKAKRTAMDEDDDAERPAVLAVLPYINCVTWHPESQDQVNHFLEETFHFFHPEGNGRFVLGYRRTGLSHWTESNADLNASDEGLNPFIQERLREIRDKKVATAIAEAQLSSDAAGEDAMLDGVRAIFETTEHIKPYWKTLEIYEMPGPFNLTIFPKDA